MCLVLYFPDLTFFIHRYKTKIVKKTLAPDIGKVADELFESVEKSYKTNTMKPKEAVEMLERVIEYKSKSKKGLTNPDITKIYFLRGMVYKRLNMYAHTVEDLQKALKSMKPR